MATIHNPMEWKKIDGYEHYEISTNGEVRTTAKNANKLMGLRMWGGYLAVKLSKGCVGKMKTIHRLLALHFIPNPDELNFVDHVNRNKLDNRIENLRWVTRGENKYNTPVTKSNRLGEKYIGRRGTSFRVSIKWDNLYRDFKTLELAVAWRNEYLTQKNMTGRL